VEIKKADQKVGREHDEKGCETYEVSIYTNQAGRSSLGFLLFSLKVEKELWSHGKNKQ